MNSLLLAALLAADPAPHPLAAEGVTSLSNAKVEYRVPDGHRVRLSRGDVTIDVVDNEATADDRLPEHRPGYNGVASLVHEHQRRNVFVPRYAGLNFEHIHDGTLNLPEPFEPRRSRMQLRVVDEFTVELHQPPTPHWKLESCGRYHLLEDGTIEYTFECIPRRELFANRTIGLFWASYINQPADGAIHFLGRRSGTNAEGSWIRSVSPRHGVDATHPPSAERFRPRIDPEFPLTLVNHLSPFESTKPWYYGVSHGMALACVFRERDGVWFAQSPTGGGEGNPAWDFQWFVPEARVGKSYGFVMRLVYVPFESRIGIERAVRPHLAALNPDR